LRTGALGRRINPLGQAVLIVKPKPPAAPPLLSGQKFDSFSAALPVPSAARRPISQLQAADSTRI
jgi:hypothetical protein